MKTFIIFFLILILLSGCSKQQKNKVDVVPVIAVNFPNNQTKIHLNDIAKNVSFIRLETNGDCLIRGVSKLEIYDDRMFVFYSGLTGSHLYCFDLQGKFLFKVGGIGQGPGEYRSLNDFAIDIENGCLWLVDDTKKILKYDLNGKFVEQYSTDFSIMNLCMIDASESLMAIRLGFNPDNNHSLLIYSLTDKKNHYQKESEIINLTRVVVTNTFYKSKERLIYAEPFNDTIFTVTKENIEPYYVIDFGKRKLPKDLFINPQPQNVIEQLTNPDNKYSGLAMNPKEISNVLFFDYYYSGKKIIAIYLRESKNVISINEFLFIGKAFEASKCYFHAKQDNQFICFLPANLLIEEITPVKKKQQLDYGSYSDITELLPNLREDDNPVMVIGELNIDTLIKLSSGLETPKQ